MNHSLSYVLGFLCGIMLVAIVCAACYLIYRAVNKRKPIVYDERQQLARGKAYRAAFWTLIGYLCVAGLFSLATGIVWCDTFTYSILGVLLSVGVFALLCIKEGAYLSLYERPRQILVILTAVMVMNIGISTMNLATGGFIADGMLTFRVTNPLCVLMMAIVELAFCRQLRKDKRQEEQA